jgi:hypothetical protein
MTGVRTAKAAESRAEPSPPDSAVMPMTSERVACRTEKIGDLTLDLGNERRNAIARLWTLSGCRACGQCADMAAR